MTRLVVFRADASVSIGNGHVVRCLALARALRSRGVECRFVCRELPGNLVETIRATGFCVSVLAAAPEQACEGEHDSRGAQEATAAPAHQLADAEATVRVVMAHRRADWIVVDHYGLDQRWESAVRACCDRLMVIEDLDGRLHDCDLLLDQNVGSGPERHAGSVDAHSTVLTGPRYALLRPEFAELRGRSLERRQSPRLGRILVSMGGTDAGNATGKVLDALATAGLPVACQVTVVMGRHAPWAAAVSTKAASLAFACEIRVDVAEMAELIADSDFAIGAGGISALERCALGVPSVLVVLSENQKPGARGLADLGAARVIGDTSGIGTRLAALIGAIDGESLRADSERAQAVCDGHGALRVASAMLMSGYDVRPMDQLDLERVLAWRNHPDVRKVMHTQHVIDIEQHRKWFCACSTDPKRHLLIVQLDGVPVGFVQFSVVETEADGGCATASWGFYADPAGPRGQGRALCQAALSHGFGALGLDKVIAEVVSTNCRSLALHEALGFLEESSSSEESKSATERGGVRHFSLLRSQWIRSGASHDRSGTHD